MPNILLEYSDNLEFDVNALLERLHESLAEVDTIRMKGIKSRAIRHTEYRVADGYEGYGFVFLDMMIREGRPIALQQEIAQLGMKILEETFASRFEAGYIALAVNVRELFNGLALNNNNIPRNGVDENGVPK